MEMTTEQLKWLLLVVSAAPISNLEEARYKAAWIEEVAEQLEPKKAE